MENKEKRYYVRVTNPHDGTYKLLKKINNELSLAFEEFWQKRDDAEVKISTKPVYSRSFDHVVSLYSRNKPYVEFAKHLVKKYISDVQALEAKLSDPQEKKENEYDNR